MNRKEKSAKFLTWNRKAGGFTLIELVVVIAIMAIIAGVAVPVYNGYINKANQAADEQLLAAVNRAAAAAVLEERNVDMATLDDDALIAENITSTIAVKYTATDDPVAAFTKYFAGNSGASFKYYNSLSFKNGVFVGARSIAAAAAAWVRELITDENGNYYKFSNGSETLFVKEADLRNLNNSSFMTLVGVDNLTKDMDTVIGAAASVIRDNNGAISNMTDFTNWLAAKGIDQSDTDKVAKALVLYTAEKTKAQNRTAAEIVTMVKNGSFATEFSNAIRNDKTQAFVDAAMAYAMVEAFAKTDEGKETYVTLDDNSQVKVPDYLASVNAKINPESGEDTLTGGEALNEVLNMLQTVSVNSDFKWYIKDDTDSGASATTDLNGYLGAMNAINDNIRNINMGTYLAEGMSGDYMKELIKQFNLSNGT